MAWNGLIIASINPLLRLEASPEAKAGLGFILFFVSLSMYYCLSEFTGAVPAEHFSAQKRVGYTEYQKTTSMIIPWFVGESPAAGGEKRAAVRSAFDALKSSAKKEKKAATPKKSRSSARSEPTTTPKRRSKSRSKSKTPAKGKAKATPRKASPSPRRTRATPGKKGK